MIETSLSPAAVFFSDVIQALSNNACLEHFTSGLNPLVARATRNPALVQQPLIAFLAGQIVDGEVGKPEQAAELLGAFLAVVNMERRQKLVTVATTAFSVAVVSKNQVRPCTYSPLEAMSMFLAAMQTHCPQLLPPFTPIRDAQSVSRIRPSLSSSALTL